MNKLKAKRKILNKYPRDIGRGVGRITGRLRAGSSCPRFASGVVSAEDNIRRVLDNNLKRPNERKKEYE